MPASGSLYFHIPFCRRKCPYCHFYVLPDKEEFKKELLEALALEWEMQRAKLSGQEIVSIYFGGGTPSLFGPQAIDTILNWIRKEFSLARDCEITLEANPEDGASLAEFAAVGINRLSLGVQSLHASTLHTLGRHHSTNHVKQALWTAYNSGIQNLSIDLMYEVPDQNLDSWNDSLNQLKELPLSHLSLYNLTFEPHTLFFKKKTQLTKQLPTPEESLHMLQKAVHALEEIGLKRYEISAFAKKGYCSRHNVGYWTARPFLGFGPSAFSYWQGKRFRNVANLRRYAELLRQGSSPIDFEETLPYPENLAELLAVELRLLRGVSLSDFQKRHGALPPATFATLTELENKGWLLRTQDHIRLSEEGLLFYDSVATEII